MADAVRGADRARARSVAARALGLREHRIAYQSRSGVAARSVARAGRERGRSASKPRAGARALVLCPIGFVCDHVEVLYDLDVEAAQTAREAGVALARASTVGVHPAFIAALSERVREACA